MGTLPREFSPRSKASSRLRATIHFPLVRMIIALLFLSPAVVAFNLVFGTMLDADTRWTTWFGDIAAVVIMVMTVGTYHLYVRIVERRSAFEVGIRRAGVTVLGGVALGVLLVIITTIPIVIGGSYQILGINPASLLVHAVFVFAMLALFEELIFRGIMLRLVEELTGTWTSIAIVAVVFGAAHLQHEGSSPLSALAIAVQDIVLSAAFVLTRRIWLSWGIHWGWNFAQDGVLGMPNSSVDELPSWLSSEVSGPTWLTGGSFGIELSVVGIAVSVAAGIVLAKMAVGRGLVVQPLWRRRRPRRD